MYRCKNSGEKKRARPTFKENAMNILINAGWVIVAVCLLIEVVCGCAGVM